MRRKTTTAEVVARLFGGNGTTVIEVGARRGGHGWYRLSPLARLIGFEADRAECERLNRLALPSGGERFVPVALGERDGPAALHLAQDAAASSLLPADADAVRRYPLLRGMIPSGTTEVTLRRLDAWALEEGCEEAAFLKLDARGTELDILRGGAGLLATCLGVELEVAFFARYAGQPLFSEVEQHLRSAGLGLWRLSGLVHYSERHSTRLPRRETAVFNGVEAPSMAGSGRLCRAHALFFRDHRALPIDTRDGVRRLLVQAALFDAAGELDGLTACLQRAAAAPREALDDASRHALAAHLREVEREF
jgi:FkbM family methyltransferase